MPNTLRRVSVYAASPQGGTQADLTLPGDCTLGELLPSIVEAMIGDTPARPSSWQLSRPCGAHLDGAMTLREHRVLDGDLILLTKSKVPAPQIISGSPAATLVASAERFDGWNQHVAAGIGLAVALLAAATLAVPARPTALGHTVALTVASAAAARAAGRARRPAAIPLALGSIGFAVAAAYLVLPQAPWPATLLLTASAGAAVATLTVWFTDPPSPVLLASAIASGTVAAVAGAGMAIGATWASTGTLLSVVSLAALALAARASMAVCGITPATAPVDEARAAVAHRTNTGLVAGWACSAALGTVAAAADRTPIAAAFGAAVGLTLLLRRRSHLDPRRRLALGSAGAGAVIAGAVAAMLAAPQHVHWIAAAAAAVGIVAIFRPTMSLLSNPIARQCIQTAEYVALAAVVPLAAWVAGAYGMVRGMSLP